MITTPQIPVDPCDLFWEVSYNNINIASGVLVRSELYVKLWGLYTYLGNMTLKRNATQSNTM